MSVKESRTWALITVTRTHIHAHTYTNMHTHAHRHIHTNTDRTCVQHAHTHTLQSQNIYRSLEIFRCFVGNKTHENLLHEKILTRIINTMKFLSIHAHVALEYFNFKRKNGF